MFIKRAKSRPSLRARETDDDLPSSPLAQPSVRAGDGSDSPSTMDVDEEEGGSVTDRKKKNKIKKKDTRLSFGGDDEATDGTPFKPRKSLLSQQIKLPSTPSAPSPPVSTSLSTPSIYSREYISQLKASTPTRLPEPREGEIETEDGLSSLARSKYSKLLVEDTTAGIPDAAAIASAKIKRQGAIEAQKLGDGEDYISLGGGQISVYDGTAGPHPESRLMREEDETGEGDEDLADYTEINDRLHLGRSANKQAARRLKGEIGEMIADREADEDDEEAMEWEMAQVRRATQWEEEVKPEKPVTKGYKPVPIPVARPMPTIAPAQARLAKSLAVLSNTKTEDERSMEQTARELASLEEQERELRREVERVEGKREWAEEFRGWVEMLGNFLEEKFPKLEDIEADSLHHITERAELTSKRRAADDSDDLALFLGVPPTTSSEDIDELARSRNTESGPHSGIRRSRREDRISRRHRRRLNRSARPQVEEDEGFSTDSSLSPGDLEDYNSATAELEYRVHALLADVKADEFRDPDKGLAVRFGDWRKRYEEEYGNAFGGLAMVQAWEFWARGEMVGWEPLRGASSIESFKWFNSLYKYSRPVSNANDNPGEAEEDDMDVEEEQPLGIDGDLVSSMVSTAVVPFLTKSFDSGSYDPYSASQTRRAIDLADLIADLTGKDSRKFTALLKSVLAIYHNHLLSLSETISKVTGQDAIPPPAFDPASRFAMERYVKRRIKLLKNILLWRRQASSEVGELITRLVSEVLRPVLGRCWGGGGREMAHKVLSVAGTVLPPDLVAFLQSGPARGY